MDKKSLSSSVNSGIFFVGLFIFGLGVYILILFQLFFPPYIETVGLAKSYSGDKHHPNSYFINAAFKYEGQILRQIIYDPLTKSEAEQLVKQKKITIFILDDDVNNTYILPNYETKDRKFKATFLPYIPILAGFVMMLIISLLKRSEKRYRRKLISKILKSHRRYDYQPNLSNAAFTISYNHGILFGFILFTIGVGALTIGSFSIFSTVSSGSKVLFSSLNEALALLPIWAGTILVPLGASHFVQTTVLIENNNINVITKSFFLFRSQSTLALDEFIGVEINNLEIRKGNNLPQWQYQVSLIHKNKKWDGLMIASLMDSPNQSYSAESIAEKLSFPLVEGFNESRNQLNIHYPKDIHKPISERLTTSTKSIGVISRKPLNAKGLEVIESADKLIVFFGENKAFYIGGLLTIISLAVAIWQGAYVILIPFGMMSAIIFASGGYRSRLELTQDDLHFKTTFFGGVLKKTHFKLSEIKKVKMGTDKLLNHSRCLEVRQDNKFFLFAQGCTEESIYWLIDRIQVAIDSASNYNRKENNNLY